ncbi:hypothetical protein C0989_012533, partial [Termitomyces sp. Mn162]
SNPPTFPEDQQFDGTNHVHFKNQVLIAAQAHGAWGYLDRTIPKPTTADIDPQNQKAKGEEASKASIPTATTKTTDWPLLNPLLQE